VLVEPTRLVWWCVCPAGFLPPSWVALTKLKVLYLFNNTLSGPLPGSWSGMAALEDLALNRNDLTGGRPQQAGRDLANMLAC
jgi:hypothetical protein